MALEGEAKRNESVQQSAVPSISLPKGGGAIRGIGEKFAANPVTGTGSMTIPIVVSPGRGGFAPQLALSYDSGAGNGPFGFGWNLSLPSITRKTDKGLPKYQDTAESDVYILSGSEDLVPVLVEVGGRWIRHVEDRAVDGTQYLVHRYRPRIEGLFARIERWTNRASGEIHWRSITKDNITTLYGRTAESRIADPSDPVRIFSWLICESHDDKGNTITYEYAPENSTNIDLTQAHERNRRHHTRSANRYIKRIRYGNLPSRRVEPNLSRMSWLFEVVFDYDEGHYEALTRDARGLEFVRADIAVTRDWAVRLDPFSSYRAGFEVRTYRRCRRVLMFHRFVELGTESCLVRTTEFDYNDLDYSIPVPVATELAHKGSTRFASFIRKVTQSAYRCQKDGSYIKRSLPPVEFDYSQAIINDEIQEIDEQNLEDLPHGLDNELYQWVDLDGEGVSGILTEQGEGWFYKRNLSPLVLGRPGGEPVVRLSPAETVALQPAMAEIDTGRQQFLDMAGDGQIDLVQFQEPVAGFHERNLEKGWSSFVPFKSRPNLSWSNPNLRFVDLTGDGHADILIAEDEVFTWYPSLGERGFGPAVHVTLPKDEEAGPGCVFADGEQSIFFADMSGDGLNDLLRIRNGEICYWPNLGYGRFGAKVTMDNAPRFDHPEHFDRRRIRIADIDGTGVNDIIYLGRDGVRLYFNQSGNRWSDARVLPQFPRIDNLSSVTAVDLLGNGTACLVWSSPLPGDRRRPMRYIDLMGGQKPHLLIKTKNNLGLETEIGYASSTRFYLADRQAGQPWSTRLPFPVHVVEKISVRDIWRKSTFLTGYSYRHGYFDGPEREFRGFGRVDQIDVESFDTFAAGNTASPYITDDRTLYQPPVKTVTWFHTGAAVERGRILSQYENEYFPNWFENLNTSATNVLGGFRENLLPEPDIAQQDLNPDEWREAMRACKGMLLRQEIYELDVDALERGEQQPVRLFSTAYHNCRIQRLQAQGANRHAVFLVTEGQAITYHYELDLTAPILTPDPRIAHTLNLNSDEYGNVLQSVAVVYPRIGRHVDPSLPAGAEELIASVQSEIHLAYTETRYTNDVNRPEQPDSYRLRAPCEAMIYELTGISPESEQDRASIDPRDNRYFTLDELRSFRLSDVHQSDGIAVDEIPYHDVPDRRTPQKRLVEHVRTLYFADNLREPLAFGQLNALGLTYETYKLALTEELLAAVFGDKLTPEIRNELAEADISGYLSGAALAARFPGVDTGGQYWIRSGIAGFADGAANHFYLPERYTDAFDNTTTLEYDTRDLHLISSTDLLGNNATVIRFDYRVLAPTEIRDANNNVSEVVFDVLGLPAAVAVKGKGDEGDRLAGIGEDWLDPDTATRIAFFTGVFDETEARRLLGDATARHIYDFGERLAADGTLSYGHRPAGAVGILREKHIAQLSAGESSPLQAMFEYSDGGGNVLVTKARAEPESEGGPLRWIANGKTVLNNKGKPVKQYEPYFSSNAQRFEELEEVGVTPVMYYDAAGRTIRTGLPDGGFSRVEFSPWHVTAFDPNDTVLESGNRWYAERIAATASVEEQRAAGLTAGHAGTPSTVFLDSLGREVIGVSHNRWRDGEGLHEEKYLAFTKLDAEGKPLWVRDARGNLVMQYITPQKPARWSDDPNENIPAGSVPCYDIAGNLLFQHSMDGGSRWTINDAAGKPFYAWDENENVENDGTLSPLEQRLFHTLYDVLHRPIEQRMQINGGGWQIIERFVYGERHAETEARNLRGQVYQHYDASGLLTKERFDFKGSVLEARRQLITTYDTVVIDWSPDSPTAGLGDEYIQRTQYDALNRMTRQENWQLDGRTPAVYTPRYNERGLLQGESLSVAGRITQAIQSIQYDAKGQRTQLVLGNGTITRYDYDPQTFRLRQLRCTRPAYDPDFPSTRGLFKNDRVLQNLYYTYDASGNITEIFDDAFEPAFFANQIVEPRSLYTYDALYRLIEANGREQYSAGGAPSQRPGDPASVFFPITSASDPNALRNYRQRYRYDAAGNILQMRHEAERGSWTRDYEYAENSNRLLRTWTGGDETIAVLYGYDTHGSMLNLNRSPDEFRLRWDYRDMIRAVNLGGGGRAFYNYDIAKQRVRKRIERNGSIIEERLYLGGMEHYRRWVNGELAEEIETHHLYAGEDRVLIVENVLATDSTELPAGVLFRYQYGNHLGSVGLELNAAADVISYEEYHPYGTTAYQARNAAVRATAKRYRYTGMERDEETGLSYHTARYYLPWLGRWGNSDPIGISGGLNLYCYSKSSPVSIFDKEGTQPHRITQHEIDSMDRSNTPSEQELAASQLGRMAADVDRLAQRYSGPGLDLTRLLALYNAVDNASESENSTNDRFTEGFRFISLLTQGLIAYDNALGRYRANFRETPGFEAIRGDAWLFTRFSAALAERSEELDSGELIQAAVITAQIILSILTSASGGRARVRQPDTSSSQPALQTVPIQTTPQPTGMVPVTTGMHIEGQVTRAATEAEIEQFERTLTTGVENVHVEYRTRAPVDVDGTARSVVPPPFDPDTTSMRHTHPPGDPAIFSRGDVRYIGNQAFESTVTHSVIGEKWARTNNVLRSLNMPTVPGVVTTTISDAMLRARNAVREIFIWE